MNRSKYLSVPVILVGLFLLSSSTFAAETNGVNAEGNLLPLGAAGTVVMNITGSPASAAVIGTLSATGTVSAPAGINVNNSGFLYSDGQASFTGNVSTTEEFLAGGQIQSSGSYDGNRGLSYYALGWDAGLSSYDTTSLKEYHLIGTYHGWDPNSVYIAGYNAGDTSANGAATSISFGGYGVGSSPTAFVDLIGHQVGVQTVTPQATLDVNGGVRVGAVSASCSSANEGTIKYVQSVHNYQFCNGSAWTPLGGSTFGAVATLSPKNNVVYANNTGGPIFLSSVCSPTPNGNGYSETVSYSVYDPSGNRVQVSNGKVAEGGSDADFSAAAYASAIVPAGYSWSSSSVFSWATGNNPACLTTAVGSVPVVLGQ